jgi:hypothetical protein
MGHYFIHQDWYSKSSLCSAQEWSAFILNLPEEEYHTLEWQADEFANRLLNPYPPMTA